MRKYIIHTIIAYLFALYSLAWGVEIPLFKLPSNDRYKLFEYNPNVSTQVNVQKKQAIKKNTNTGLKIYGIFISDGKRVVLIGDKIYKEGQKVGDYTIKEIKNDRIILLKGSREIVEHLEQQSNPVKFQNNTIETP